MMLLLLAALAAEPTLPPPANAEQSDGRCVAIFTHMNSPDPRAKQLAQTGGVYFLGKLKGRNPSVNLAALLGAMTKIVATAPQTEFKRCAVELEASGQSLNSALQASQPKPAH